MPDFPSRVEQNADGEGHIFTATGDIYVTQNPVPPAEQKTREDVGKLLNKVRTFWVEGVLEKSLYNSELLSLNKEAKPEAIDHPWSTILELPDQTSQTMPAGTKTSDIFEQLNRALLILGDPGSGKTITLLDLARDLLDRAEKDKNFGQPIPVVFNLSSWAVNRQSLVDWMISELSVRYQIPKQFGRAWLEESRLLPLLDGLDEVAEEHRPACVQAINEFSAYSGLAGLAVCCRISDYRRLPTKLKLNGAIFIQSLTPEKIDEFLNRPEAKFQVIRELLNQDRDLMTLAQSPLILNLILIAYENISPEELQALDSTEARRNYILGAFVRRMFERRPAHKGYSPEQSIHWLAVLARYMEKNSQTIFLLEQIQPDWFEGITRIFYNILRFIVIGLIIGLIIGPVFGWLAGLLLTSFLAGLYTIGRITPTESLTLSWKQAVRGLLLGSLVGFTPIWLGKLYEWMGLFPGKLMDGLMIGMITWIILGLFREQEAAIGISVVMVIAFGVVGREAISLDFISWALPLLYIVIWGAKNATVADRVSPNEGIHRSLRFALLFAGGGILPFLFFLPEGWALGSMIGLIYGGAAVIMHYLLRLMLYLKSYTPLNYIDFLNFATDHSFLQRVGGGYVFMHRRLLEYFRNFN